MKFIARLSVLVLALAMAALTAGASEVPWRIFLAEGLTPTQLAVVQTTLWQQHQNTIIVALLAFCALGAVIALLLIQKHKRQAAEKLLRESEDRMAFAAASMNIGIWWLDIATGRLRATGHCRSMFDIAADAPLIWELFRNAVHPDDRQTFDEGLQSLDCTSHFKGIEFRVELAGDDPRWYLFRRHTVCDEKGKLLRVSGIFIDITARKTAEAETELQRKELMHVMRVAALGELSGGIAHELSQPLAAILANAQAAQGLLANKDYDKGEVAEILEDIVQEDNRAGQVIHRLRRLLKKGEQQSALISLNDLIQSTLGLLHSELMGRKIKVETKLKMNLPQVWGDSVQLQQVLLNLIMNAMEAMALTPPSNRTVSIETRTTEEGYVEVSIADRGPGIPPDALEQLFQPYFTTKERGLGLGLSICSTIVKSHRGTLTVSNARGGGAIAIVSVPSPLEVALAS
jgi:C4-dicarboxylate-specific signal transduction histidine kinase